MPRVSRADRRDELTNTPLLRHYLLIAIRSVARHKLYSFINVLGLSVALTCTIFVILFVRYQLSYDKWIPGTQDLYRVESTLRNPSGAPIDSAPTAYPLGVAMREQIPGITGMTRLHPETLTLAEGDRQFPERDVDFVDSNFFRIIRVPFVEGSPGTALSQPESVVLSQSTARKYFGNTDPMGRTLITTVGSCPNQGSSCGGKTVSLEVTGIVRDLPKNSQLTGDVFIPITSLADPDSPSVRQTWFELRPFTYITLAPGIRPAAILAAMPRTLDQDVTGVRQLLGVAWRGSQVYRIHLTPFTQVHLNSSRWPNNLTPPGSWNTLYGVVIIGVLILLVACFNFTNLATARAALRAREIGLRKTSGATRRQLTFQFLSEAVFLALLSLAVAAAAAELLLPAFNSFLHQSIALNYASDWRLDLILIGVATGAGLVSGIYPALILSRLRPVGVFQAVTRGAKSSLGLREVLVLMQFAVSIALGIAAIVVFRQVNYARNMNLGFRRNNIVVIQNSDLAGARQEAFARALRANPGISQVGLSGFVPFARRKNFANIQVPGQPSQLTLTWVPIGPDYLRTYGIALVSGRLLSASRGDDRFSLTGANQGRNVLINVAAARRLGFTPQNAVGQPVRYNATGVPIEVHIVGVLADARTQGAREPVAPTVYSYYPNYPMDFSVCLRLDRISQTLAFIDRTWHAFVPTVAIQRSFLSADFARLYRSDERQGTVFSVFVVIAIFIACLGLYGLAVFTADRRTKEIAVRKISGAGTLAIMNLMLWRISVPVLLANAIAWPVAYYFLQRWLQGFADHVWLNPMYFVMCGAIALLVAWATVFVHTLHLAHTSPVHALRYE
jgi:putative ABC transport system permease protein